MTNKGFYSGELEEIEENLFEVAILDMKKVKRYIFYLKFSFSEQYMEIGWEKKIFGKMKIMNRVQAFPSIDINDICLLKTFLKMIARYCCLYSKIEKDAGIDALISFSLESILMDEAREVFVGNEKY